jgi:hypothetical protein
MLLRYANQKAKTRKLNGIFRSFAPTGKQEDVILVGDKGRILKIEGEKFSELLGTRENLRGISMNPNDGRGLIVGNAGSAMVLENGSNLSGINTSTSENLRAVSWNSDGELALIAGNGGLLLEYSDKGVQAIQGGRANLRHVAWRPGTKLALVTSNCFAEEFIPSPNLFMYDGEKKTLKSLNEGRVDLIGADWKSDGTVALVVGYDVIWHTGVIAFSEGERLSLVEFDNKRVYPVAVSWSPTQPVAAVATATTQPDIGEGIVYLWNNKTLTPIFRNNEFFFSTIAWSRDGTELFALGSSVTRTFNC